MNLEDVDLKIFDITPIATQLQEIPYCGEELKCFFIEAYTIATENTTTWPGTAKTTSIAEVNPDVEIEADKAKQITICLHLIVSALSKAISRGTDNLEPGLKARICDDRLHLIHRFSEPLTFHFLEEVSVTISYLAKELKAIADDNNYQALSDDFQTSCNDLVNIARIDYGTPNTDENNK